MRAWLYALAMAAVFSVAGMLPRDAQAQQVLDRLERILRDDVLPRIPAANPGTQPQQRNYAPTTEEVPPAPTPPAAIPSAAPPTAVAPAIPSGTSGGYFGVVGDDRDTRGRGVEVISVRDRAPAAVAGLKPGDLIIALRGQGVRTLEEFARALDGQPEGARVEVIFQRGERNYSTTVVLGPRPDAPATDPSGLPAEPVFPNTPPQLGVRVLTIPEAARQGYAIYVRAGAVVATIEKDSPADRARLSTGAVIVGIDNRRVNDPGDLAAIVKTYRWGQVINLLYYRGDQVFRMQVPLLPAGYTDDGVPGPTVLDPPLVLKPKITEFPPSTPRVVPTPPTPDPELVPPAPVAPTAPVPQSKPAPLDPLLPAAPQTTAKPPTVVSPSVLLPMTPMPKKPVDLSELEERLGVKPPTLTPATPADPLLTPPTLTPATPPPAEATPMDEVGKLRTQMAMIREEANRLREQSQMLEKVLAELQSRLDKLTPPPVPPAPMP